MTEPKKLKDMTDAQIAAIVRSSEFEREYWDCEDWVLDNSELLHPDVAYRLKPKPREWWIVDTLNIVVYNNPDWAKRKAEREGCEVIHVREVMEEDDDK